MKDDGISPPKNTCSGSQISSFLVTFSGGKVHIHKVLLGTSVASGATLWC